MKFQELDENESDLKELFPYLGEYLATYNQLIFTMEWMLGDWLIFSEHYRGSKVNGLNFKASKTKLSLLETFDEEAQKMLNKSIHIYTVKQLKIAKKTLKKLYLKLDSINLGRNIIVHGYWHDWENSHSIIKKSTLVNKKTKRGIKVNLKGYTSYQISLNDLQDEIKSIEDAIEEVFIFWEMYQRGWNINERKYSKKRKLQLNYDKPWKSPQKRGFKNLNITTILQLERLEIYDVNDLKKVGAQEAYKKLIQEGHPMSLRLLYSLIGAIEQKDWREISKNYKN